MSEEVLTGWALVEVMGHRRYVGRVCEQVVAGHGFLRVDVPEVGDIKPFTRLIGTASIYGITPVDEATARALLQRYDYRPPEAYLVTINTPIKPTREELEAPRHQPFDDSQDVDQEYEDEDDDDLDPFEEAHDELDALGLPEEEDLDEAEERALLESVLAERAIPVVDQEPFEEFGEAVEEATSSVEQLVKASSGVIPRSSASIVPPSVGKCFEPDE